MNNLNTIIDAILSRHGPIESRDTLRDELVAALEAAPAAPSAPEHGCKWPTCQSEAEQDKIAAEVYAALYIDWEHLYNEMAKRNADAQSEIARLRLVPPSAPAVSDLPPLPDPTICHLTPLDKPTAYSANQMRDYGLKCRRATLAEVAALSPQAQSSAPDEREAFEKWYAKNYIVTTRIGTEPLEWDGNGYADVIHNRAWKAFRAGAALSLQAEKKGTEMTDERKAFEAFIRDEHMNLDESGDAWKAWQRRAEWAKIAEAEKWDAGYAQGRDEALEEVARAIRNIQTQGE